jgi:hypothetical protein
MWAEITVLYSQKLQWVLLEQKQTSPQLLGKYLKEKTCSVESVGNHGVNFMGHKLGVSYIKGTAAAES